jgi:hypothetical protein
MRAYEFINEALDYETIFKQIDANRAAGIKPQHPVIGGVERSPEQIRKEILSGGTLETEPVDKEALKKWSQQQNAKQRAGNFLGIGDMLSADEKAGRKLTPNEFRSQNIGTTASQPSAVKTIPAPRLPRGGGGTNLDRADPNSWRAPIEDPFQTSFDPKRTTDQMRYDRLRKGY